jgi:hypothetical protein
MTMWNRKKKKRGEKGREREEKMRERKGDLS